MAPLPTQPVQRCQWRQGWQMQFSSSKLNIQCNVNRIYVLKCKSTKTNWIKTPPFSTSSVLPVTARLTNSIFIFKLEFPKQWFMYSNASLQKCITNWIQIEPSLLNLFSVASDGKVDKCNLHLQNWIFNAMWIQTMYSNASLQKCITNWIQFNLFSVASDGKVDKFNLHIQNWIFNAMWIRFMYSNASLQKCKKNPILEVVFWHFSTFSALPVTARLTNSMVAFEIDVTQLFRREI